MTGEASTTARRDRRAHVWRIVLLVSAVLLAALVLLWDWNWLKGPIERRVSAATGRKFDIAGPLDVDLGRIIVVKVEDLSLANTAWSLTPEMARADLLRLEIPFWPLLRGDRTLRRVDVVRPALLLERNPKGEANWQFGKRGAAQAEPRPGWSFGEVRIHEGHLDVRDSPLDTDLRLTVDSAEPQAGDESVRLLVRGTGRYRGHPFQLVGSADSPVALLERADAAYRVDFSARAGATRARMHGALQVPLNPAHFTINAELRGDDLGDLYPLIGLAIPSTPPYRIEGKLERDGRVVTLRQMQGRVGDSDVAGVVSVDLRGDKPLLQGQLVSEHLDFDDLGPLIGLPPNVTEGSASPEQRAEAAARKASPKLLPDKEFNLKKLGAMNADVRLQAKDVDAGKWPIESLTAHVRLRDSLLTVEPFDLGFAGGKVDGAVKLDAGRPRIDAATDLSLRSIDLERMFPKMQPPNIGRMNGRIDLRGNGNSVAAMLGTADGEVQVGMGRGKFSNLLLELAGLDVAESLKFLLSKDHTVKLRCAYGDFGVEDGKAKARTMVFDTTDTVVFGDGSINLDKEALSLELRPEPKDFSPVSLRGPLEIGGTFKDPTFRPQGKSLLGRAAAAAALYAIAPPAALLALIETGPGENVDCYTGKKQHGGKDDDKGRKRDQAEARRAEHHKGQG